MIKDAGSKFDDYSISPKIRQILLHWGFELAEKDFLSTQFQTIIYINSEFNFHKKINLYFIGSILDNTLDNQCNNLHD